MVTEAHKEFTKEIVKLARQYGMGSLQAKFQLSFMNIGRGRFDTDQVDMTWSEGRHGAKTIIHLQSTEHVHIDEAKEHITNPFTKEER